MIRLLGFLTSLTFLVSACSVDRSSVVQTSELGYQDTLDFSFDSFSSSQSTLALTLTHADNFSYQNIYFNIGFQVENRAKLFSAQSFQLSSKEGVWLGRCKAGACRLTTDIRIPPALTDGGSLKISLTQNSREPSLQGIRAVGVSLK